jgi:hypothetical protein
MIHVPDVRATVEWYASIGFAVSDTYEDGGDGLSFALLSCGTSEVMFNAGGNLYLRLKDRVEVVEGLHDTFYGMREFILRDLSRFWVTFGQELAAS